MIYFENYEKSLAGLNNHLVSYTLCISLSNFLNRDFFFDYELPCTTPPIFAVEGKHKNKFEILMKSKRSLISDLVKTPARRLDKIDRNVENKIRFEDLQLHFLTTKNQVNKYKETFILDQFSLGREALLKEDLQTYDLIEIGDINLVNVSYFYFLKREEKNNLLKSVRIIYKEDIEKLAKRICETLGKFNSIHIRMGDFLDYYGQFGYSLNLERFKAYVDANFVDKQIPILIATDGLEEKEFFKKLLKNFKYTFIDELIFDEFKAEFCSLKFNDFNVLSVLNQLICANSIEFIGTFRSTFTSMIHRLRQERFGKTDFKFFPDERVKRILSEDYKIVKDSWGFFEWNHYTICSVNNTYPAFMREWNFNLTSLND